MSTPFVARSSPRCPNGGKVQYASAAKARKHARKSHEKMPGTTFRTYVCPHCGFYHLTKQPQPNERTTQ
jgi:predicted RNA-binding Zn-ribbon protein involved in translation (DUF1610 family)